VAAPLTFAPMGALRGAAFAATAIVLCAVALAASPAHGDAPDGGRRAVHTDASPAATPPHGSPVGDARVTGTFAMSATITAARNVRGEHVGQVLMRRWVLNALECAASVCPSLTLEREREAGIHETLTLTRTGPGTYAGGSTFHVPLRCHHRLHPRGARAPYRIELAVAAVETVGGIAYARQITATYVNHRRIDATRCPLGPSHDAAIYTGSATSPLPAPEPPAPPSGAPPTAPPAASQARR
jgi:hypothetical protein